MKDNILISSANAALSFNEEGIFGFSGSSLKYDQGEYQPLSMLVQNRYWKAFLFYRPAEINYHLPQDTLGVSFEGEKILFAIADGVSIVGGTSDNQSGQVSFDLVKASLLRHSITAKYKYAHGRVEGASTLQYGILDKSQLSASFFGEPENLGHFACLGEPYGLREIVSNSTNFFPESMQPDQILVSDSVVNGVVLTSDGAEFSRSDILLLASFLQKETSDKLIEGKLLSTLRYSKDDQSVILVVRQVLP